MSETAFHESEQAIDGGRNPHYERQFLDEPDWCWRLRKELIGVLDNADTHHERLEARIAELKRELARVREENAELRGYDSSADMSLRDAIAMRMPEFSGHVSALFAANRLGWSTPKFDAEINWAEWWHAVNAAYRYRQADAMLRARESLDDPFAE